MKVVLIGTDTPHRRYIINKLINKGHNIAHCIFETTQKTPPFETRSDWEVAGESELKACLAEGGCDVIPEHVSVKYVETLNGDETVRCMKRIKFDICIVSGARQLVGDILGIVAKRGVNLHMGIATNYRGLDTNLWAIYHRDFTNIGVTLHRLDNTLDTGDIYEAAKIHFGRIKHLHLLRLYEAELSVDLLDVHLKKLTNGSLKAVPQKSVGRYYSFMPAIIKNGIQDNLPI